MNQNETDRQMKFNWISSILFITALLAVFQIMFILSASDDTIISLTKAMAKAERDQEAGSSYFRGRTDEEIDRIVEERRSAVTQTFRKESTGTVIIKLVFALLLLIVGLGVRKQKPRPTRVLAIIVGIVLLIGLIASFGNMSKSLKAFKYIESKTVIFLDMGWFIFVLLSMIACFVAFFALKKIGGEKKERNSDSPSPT